MAYDAVVESLRLIESRVLTPATRLSRRRRYLAMAVDVADDLAVTMFARRSVGCNVEEIHVFALHGSDWTLLGGGGGPLDDNALDYRPTELPPTYGASPQIDGRVIAIGSTGGTLDCE